MLEAMVKTLKWKTRQWIGDTDGKCRSCGQDDETVQHQFAECEMLAEIF